VASFREAARGLIGQKQVRDLNPYTFLLAERKASKLAFEAMSKKDYAEAQMQKQRELLNHYLYVEAAKAQAEAANYYKRVDPNDPTYDDQAYAKAMQKLYIAQSALKRYNINYNPFAAGQGPDGDTNGTSGSNTDIQEYISAPNPSLAPEWLQNLMTAIGGNELKPAEKLALGEFLAKYSSVENDMRNQQKAINVASEAGTARENDPAYQAYLSGSQDMFDNPITSDWEGIRNRLSSDYAKGREQTSTGLSESLAGRGLSAGTGAGIQAMLNSQNQMDLSRALGESEVAQTDELRSGKFQGLQAFGDSQRMSQGMKNLTSSQIQSLLMGKPPESSTGMEGMANTGMNFLSSQWMKDAMDDAGDEGNPWADFGMNLMTSWVSGGGLG
jgi:hypothetical protein